MGSEMCIRDRNLDVVEILELDDAKFVNANTQSDIIEYTATLEGTIE